MAGKIEVVETAAVAVPEVRRRIARRTAFGCALIALLSFGACSILPPEHAPDLSKIKRLELVSREANRLTFKFNGYLKPGGEPGGVALWFGDKDRIIMNQTSDIGTTTVEYTPEGLFWTTECESEGVFSKSSHMAAGPMLLSDFVFRPDPLTPGPDGRIAIGDGVRPGQAKVTVYLSVAQFKNGAK